MVFLTYEHASGEALIGENVDQTKVDTLKHVIAGVKVYF